jgi:hypothetical protein
VFAESFEQRTENPRVENLVITPVNTHPEGSDLIGAFLCLTVFRRGDIPVFGLACLFLSMLIYILKDLKNNILHKYQHYKVLSIIKLC